MSCQGNRWTSGKVGELTSRSELIWYRKAIGRLSLGCFHMLPHIMSSGRRVFSIYMYNDR